MTNHILRGIRRAFCIVSALGLSATALVVAPVASAQTWPDRPIRIVVPFPPGAANDLVARTLAGEMTGFGTVIVDNRPGGNGKIGADVVKNANDNGHTLLFASNAYTIYHAIAPDRTWDMSREFEPVVLTNLLPFFVTVNPEALPVKDARELLAWAKSNPGKLIYFSPGVGTPHHLGMELFKLQTGIDAVHVPYKGMGPGVVDFLAGRVHMTITGYPAIAKHVEAGKVRILATSETKRASFRPDVPTLSESGVPGVDLETWLGLLLPSGAPAVAVQRLNAEFNRVLQLPKVRERFAAAGMDTIGGAPDALRQHILRDMQKWPRVVKAGNIKPE